MKTTKLFMLILATSTALQAGEIEILSVTTGGRLTFTNSVTNGLFTIQWAASPLTNWNENWNPLKDFVVTGGTVSVDIPIIYRVKCVTNLLWPMPIGSSWLQRGSNAIGQVWTNRGTVVGSLNLPSKGKEFSIIEMTFSQSPYNLSLIPLRSTETAIYKLDPRCGEEEMGFTNVLVGTCWTNTSCGRVSSACIETNELVTVPAGTFPCLRVRKQRLNTSDPNPVWIEWWSPGVGIPKWIDYYVDASEHPPIVYELISLTTNPK